MKHSVITAIITGTVAVGAGVAIAGLPASTPADRFVISGEVVTASPAAPPGAPTTVDSSIDDATSAPPDATTATTLAAPTSTQPAQPDSSPSTTAVSNPIPRAELRVAIANATDQSGIAGHAAEALRPLGYDNIRPVDADPTSTSAVFYAPGLEAEAAQLANDILFKPTQIAPMELMPALRTELTFDLVAVIGLDRV